MKLYSKITSFFIVWIIAVYLVSYFGFLTLPHSLNFTGNFFESWANNWDGGHYLVIAKFGYREKSDFAFFPVYPLAVRFVNQILHNYSFSAMLVSVVSTYLAFNFFYSVILKDFNKKITDKALTAFLIFPTSFYLLAGYSEGLFLLFVCATFYFLRENRLLIATICCALATATRLAGIAVCFAFLFEIITTKGINKKNFHILFAPLGLILYGWFLFNRTSDPLYFITAESSWQRYLTIPGNGIWETIKSFSRDGISSTNINIFIDYLFTVFGLGMILRGFRFLPPSFLIYGLISLLLPLFTTSLTSMPRFVLAIFPIFILIAIIKNEKLLFAYQLTSIMLLSIFSVMFINGYWVS